MTPSKTSPGTGSTTAPPRKPVERSLTSVSTPTSKHFRASPAASTRPRPEPSSMSTASGWWPVTVHSHGSSSDPTQRSSMSDARPGCGARRNERRSSPGIATARDRDVGQSLGTATFIMSSTGRMEEQPPSRTDGSSVGHATPSSISRSASNGDSGHEPRGGSSPPPRQGEDRYLEREAARRDFLRAAVRECRTPLLAAASIFF
jgi:hypothetical protein